ncbi:glycoside hydrolase family 32 protein [Daldinia vernicosa]|uniref:glycoside hydrolase family 32 protein n=1 Tax=Daldinia vernicosa TaxID=114800 RepID=UPI00200804AA|nr:glycoside hydrolase family 32 protein [Daldinia vernicosa]KAI0850303.1 glycoside hydrolase family 32 protein [Daldinia vernicosa]
MKLTPAVLAGTLAARQDIDYNAAPPNLSTLANSSLFETWRPKAHVLPPSGQIGDPCMHYTDPETGLFHVGWLHNGAAGATTDDLVTYHDANPDGRPFIVAGGKNDPISVFDGSVIPSGIDGKPTLLYTSVSYLPIQWTIPYTRGSETQSLAVSRDGGRNFTKLEQGPVIPSPPFAVNVTGFRDPFVFQNSQLDTELGSAPGTWYTVISGGVHGEGPSQFLYRQHDPEFQYWEELGQWWHEPANTTWGNGDWAGRWGFNFEVANIFALDEQGYNAEGEIFTTLGTEWSLDPIVPQVSDFREMLWAAGNISREDGKLKFQPNMAGKLDWGTSAYAAAGKELPATSKASQKSGAPDRFITYLWLTGNFYDTLDFPTNQQNWTGALLLPRELSVGKISNVVDNELVRETGSWRVGSNESGLVELVTLKQEIAREVLAALTSGGSTVEPGRTLNSPGAIAFQNIPESKFYVITATLSFPNASRESDLRAGFQILSSEYESTTIYYQFSNESIIIDRSNSSAAAKTTNGIDSRNEAGRLRLFDLVQDGQQEIESLNLTIVVDNSIVEVHANGRFALSTWARSWYAASREIRFFHDGEGEVVFGDVTVHEGLYDAWPDRKGEQ